MSGKSRGGESLEAMALIGADTKVWSKNLNIQVILNGAELREASQRL
jgi:hypothetical protein